MSPRKLINFLTLSFCRWSYGILLYEIFTFGATPYPGIATSDLLKELLRGYRMDKPSNNHCKCSNEMYQLMLDCWQKDKLSRPSFVEIKEKLNYLMAKLDDNQDDYYLELPFLPNM